ncbi:hypothetical protein C8Q77DRAFT_1129436 [Trametes polyzona]|nr:hypothetical protein C8Q77DRAFT_1129436 [Trametes polyzona]
MRAHLRPAPPKKPLLDAFSRLFYPKVEGDGFFIPNSRTVGSAGHPHNSAGQ